MKTTPLAHTRTRARIWSILLWPGFCLSLPAAELQFTLTPTANNKQFGTAYASADDIDDARAQQGSGSVGGIRDRQIGEAVAVDIASRGIGSTELFVIGGGGQGEL